MRLLLVPLVLVAACAAGCAKPSCVVNTDCQSGLVCADPGGGGGRTCANPCAADLRCQVGQACIARDDGSFEGACLAVTGKTKTGDKCSADRDCDSGACESTVCVDTCDLAAPCTSGTDRCTLAGLRHVCVPPGGDKAVGDACTSSTECTTGTCVLPPDQSASVCADNCSDKVACTAAADVCVRLTGGARACLAPLVDGATCQDESACAGGFCIADFDGTKKCASACDNGVCAAGFGCESQADSNGDGKVDSHDSSVCMPVLDTKAAGDTCTHARDCASLHCAHFASDTQDYGLLCADPCDASGNCTAPDVCWDDPDPNGTDVCGPNPN